MTETQQAIEDAIKGGWVSPLGSEYTVKHVSDKAVWFECGGKHDEAVWLSEILLNPKFWQAVGKTRGWDVLEDGRTWQSKKFGFMPVWLHYQHRFIDHLARGKTIEEALQAIR